MHNTTAQNSLWPVSVRSGHQHKHEWNIHTQKLYQELTKSTATRSIDQDTNIMQHMAVFITPAYAVYNATNDRFVMEAIVATSQARGPRANKLLHKGGNFQSLKRTIAT